MNPSHTLALIGPIGTQELLIIGIIMLILFGRRLPEVGRSLGQGIVEFKKGLKDVTDDIKYEVDAAASEKPAPSSPPPSTLSQSEDEHTLPSGAHESSTQVRAQSEPTGES